MRLTSAPTPEEDDVARDSGPFMRMEVRSEAPETNSIRYPESSGRMPELAPIYAPNVRSANPPSGAPAQASTQSGQAGRAAGSYQGGYLQGVYWPYRYQPYESGSRWAYPYWPYENNVYWQGSPWPYERAENQPRKYETLRAVTLDPQVSSSVSGEPLSEDERAELEMWRRLSEMPVEVTFYGQEAFVQWGGSSARIPVPKDGKIQIKLSPQQ
ncbi:MAG: hypothetical protein V1746_00525 [bacterium]